MAGEIGNLNGKLAYAQRKIDSLLQKEQSLMRELQASRRNPLSPSRSSSVIHTLREREVEEQRGTAALLDLTQQLLTTKSALDAAGSELEAVRNALSTEKQQREAACVAKDAEISSIRHARQECEATNETLRSRISELSEELRESTRQSAELFDALSAANSAVESGRRDVESMHEEMLAFKASQRDTERRTSQQAEEISALQSSLRESTAMQVALEEEIAKSRVTIAGQAATITTLQARLTAAGQEKAELSELEASCVALMQSSEDVQRRYDEAKDVWRKQEESLCRKVATLTAELKEFESRDGVAKVTIEELIQRVQGQQQDATVADSKLKAEQARSQSLSEQLHAVNGLLSTSQQQCLELQRTIDMMRARLLEAESREARQRIVAAKSHLLTFDVSSQTIDGLGSVSISTVHEAIEKKDVASEVNTESASIQSEVQIACKQLIVATTKGQKKLKQELEGICEAVTSLVKLSSSRSGDDRDTMAANMSPLPRGPASDFLSPPVTPFPAVPPSGEGSKGYDGKEWASHLQEATLSAEYDYVTLLELCRTVLQGLRRLALVRGKLQ